MARDKWLGAKVTYALKDKATVGNIHVVRVQRKRVKGGTTSTDYISFIQSEIPSEESVVDIITRYEKDVNPYKPTIPFTTELRSISRFSKLVEALGKPETQFKITKP
jgi:hypothetical protein